MVAIYEEDYSWLYNTWEKWEEQIRGFAIKDTIKRKTIYINNQESKIEQHN